MLSYLDNTRISAYRECPRKFYLRHIRDWVSEGKNVDLIFGLAWHEAMNSLWASVIEGKSKQEIIKLAYLAFCQCWVENGLESVSPDNYQILTQKYEPKTPFVALEMLENYYEQRKDFIRECSEVEIEKPFAIPLMEIPVEKHDPKQSHRTIYLIGRLDKVVKHRMQGRLIIEHKTTGWYAKEGGFRSDYIESFSPNSQVDGYLFAGNSLYSDGVRALWVDAALTHKTVHDKFRFIPVDRQFAALDAWHTDTMIWTARILKEIESHATHVPTTETAMAVFPKNTSSCHIYSGCSFRNVCKFVPNPALTKLPPPGYKVERWEPFDTLKIGQILEKEGD